MRLATVALGLLVAVAAGCARGPSDADATVLVRGNGSGPDSLDPQKARTVQGQEVLRDLCESLTALDPSAAVAPGAASAWSAEEGGLTYRFTLRHGARWSNGDPVVAADFVAALQRLVDPATASAYAEVVDVIANARSIIAGKSPPSALGVSAPDDSTVIVRLASPAPYLPALLSHPSTCPVHRPTLTRYGSGFAQPGRAVSNGAFTLAEWVPGSHVLIKRNHFYWNDAGNHIEAVRYVEVPDESAELWVRAAVNRLRSRKV